MSSQLQLTDWRRQVSELYAAVRAASAPAQGHALWRTGRDALFRDHPQSPLLADDPMRTNGVPYLPYDPAYRFEVTLLAPDREQTLHVPTPGDGVIELELIGHLELPAPLGIRLDAWWLHQYAGGLFVPLKDGTAGNSSYGGGRYLLDTAKGADLGGTHGGVVLDLNFAYHPSCRYNPDWVCPLAPAGNITPIAIHAGEIMTGG